MGQEAGVEMSAVDAERRDRQISARIAGLCYLLVIAGGLFAEGFVRGSLTVPGEARATMLALTQQEQLWRTGLAVHLLYLVLTVPMSVLLYRLLRPFGESLATMALAFSLICSTIEAGSLVQTAVPLTILRSTNALAAFSPQQLDATAFLAIRLFSAGFAFALIFFSGFCALTGVLIIRSSIVPKLIGAMMIAAGACYMANSLTGILSPQSAHMLFPWILLPSLLGELSLALWLLVRGTGAGSARRAAPR